MPSFFEKEREEFLRIFEGWTGKPAHPDSPAGGGGPGSFRQPGPLNHVHVHGHLPHPHSPAGRMHHFDAKDLHRHQSGAVSKRPIEGLLYPLAVKATADYHSGMRRFGAPRAHGRKHAGIDLYVPAGTVVRAMAAGEVINVHPFYCHT